MYALPFCLLTFQIKNRAADDALELMTNLTTEDLKEKWRQHALSSLSLAREQLDAKDEAIDPLEWWPTNPHFAFLFEVAKMMFAIPASTADNERAFSSAGNTLGVNRGNLSSDNFRMEHRIRTYLTIGGSLHTSAGREMRLTRANSLLQQLSEQV